MPKNLQLSNVAVFVIMLSGYKLSTLEKLKTEDSANPKAYMLSLAAQKNLVDNTEENEECLHFYVVHRCSPK